MVYQAEIVQRLWMICKQQTPAEILQCLRLLGKSQYALIPCKINQYTMLLISRHIIADYFLRFWCSLLYDASYFLQFCLYAGGESGDVFLNGFKFCRCLHDRFF